MSKVFSPTLIEDFLRRVKVTRSHSTHRSYKSVMGIVTKKLQDLPFNEHSLLYVIEDWKQEVSINTIKYRLIVMIQYLKHTNQYETWVEDIAKSMASEYPLQGCPTPEEFEKILGKIKTHKYRAILLLMAESGARVSEVVGIELKDIHLQQGIIVVRNTKNNEDKILRLSKRTLENIQFYRERERLDTSNTKLFTSKHGEQTVIATQKAIKKFCYLAGLSKYHCHSFRHYFAQRLIDANCSLPIVQKAMGHKSSKSTEKYFKVDYRTVINAVDQVFN